MVAAATTSSNLQTMLQRAVQAVQWTYIIYWKLCSLQRILVWGDGYYNGAIKTRKTVQSKEVSTEEASLQRSHQLRELYEMLRTGRGETTNNHHTKTLSVASLSPEDLTGSEWFYLMCFSYSFPPGVELPGKSYAKKQHVWLTGASEVNSQTFSRAILAKSAQIQTVVCIPLLDGVVEIGTTEKVEEDVEFIQQISSLFIPVVPVVAVATKPALSEHSTSNPPTTSPAPPYITISTHIANNTNQIENDDNEDDFRDEEEVGATSCGGDNSDTISSDGQVMMIHNNPNSSIHQSQTQSSDLMQLDISSHDIRSPDYASNNMDSNYLHHILPTPTGVQIGNQGLEELGRVQYGDYDQDQDPLLRIFHAPLSPSGGVSSFNELPMQEDTQYSQTVEAILQRQLTNRLCADISISSATSYIRHPSYSAFFKWSYSGGCSASNHLANASTSQRMLKYILFTLPFLPNSKNGSQKPSCTTSSYLASREELTSANHVIEEFLHNSKEISSQKPSTASFYPEELTSANHVLEEFLHNSKEIGSQKPSTTSFYPVSRDELNSANHVLSERRRREKLKERFIILRSLVPFVTKMDKASILGDTIEYIKYLRNKIQELEEAQAQAKENTIIEVNDPKSGESSSSSSSSMINNKKKRRAKRGKRKAGQQPVDQSEKGEVHVVEVSIIEKDALVEMQCPHREGLLLDVMQMLRQLRLEITTVQSSLSNGLFVAKLRAKVKKNPNGKNATIMEVKKAIHQTVSPPK